MLGQKLDYELDSLQSRMQEVEESVDDFERRVMDIEASVRTLLAERQKEEIKRPAENEVAGRGAIYAPGKRRVELLLQSSDLVQRRSHA
ncbi:hypothetical protein H2198_008879 [Neophaeococcomyces mojaviensis]|uniref:Uncharacterized protein n=1 Tax=Neophaeococcomyces mojaviensis TaxID=3383035 RepID=A0ACC2ZWK2_9EURO|nr:hypothetical protein H2198_008879 [Knufia sp. JES_112]